MNYSQIDTRTVEHNLRLVEHWLSTEKGRLPDRYASLAKKLAPFRDEATAADDYDRSIVYSQTITMLFTMSSFFIRARYTDLRAKKRPPQRRN